MTISIQSFMTPTTKEVYREGFNSLYTLFKNNPLYSDDIAKMCCEYALYDKENHTLLKTTKASIVNWLVENGEDIHANGEEALKIAIQRGLKSVVEALLYHGANVSINRYEPVELAIDCGHVDIVELLLKQDLNSLDFDNYYFFRLAVCEGHLNIAELFLRLGVSVHVQDDFMIRHACKHSYFKMVQLAIKWRANIHIRSGQLISMTMNPRILLFLFDNGAIIPPRFRGTIIQSFLDYCISKLVVINPVLEFRVITEFLRHGARVNHQTMKLITDLLISDEIFDAILTTRIGAMNPRLPANEFFGIESNELLESHKLWWHPLTYYNQENKIRIVFEKAKHYSLTIRDLFSSLDTFCSILFIVSRNNIFNDFIDWILEQEDIEVVCQKCKKLGYTLVELQIRNYLINKK